MTRRFTKGVVLAAALLSACARDQAAGERRTDADTPPVPPAASAWRTNPTAAVDLAVGGDSLVVETGPHTILWPAAGQALEPPYTLRAVFQKRHGRLHEGYGILFGGSGLEGPEAGQVYSYFLVRGDGAFLVKRRQGMETPVVRDWTQQAALHRDQEEVGRPNELEVRVTAVDVAFLANGVEVARVPAAELSIRGLAGVRTSHEVSLVVRGFRAEPGAPR